MSDRRPSGASNRRTSGASVSSRGDVKPVQYNQLGNSGLTVSNICLGTMTFGEHDRPGNCNEAKAHTIMNRYLELGGNFIDTADVYCDGNSEKIVGTWMKSDHVSRDKLVIATKARFDPGKQGVLNGACLSRKHLVSQVEQSLQRLQTSYIDLYQWHCWDKVTPLEESLRTMNDLVRSGKIHYFGTSNLCGWQLQKVVTTCKYLGLSPCISLQQQYNLLNREVELEVGDVCQNEGLALLPWSPLKGGWLTGKFKRDAPSENFENFKDTRIGFSTIKDMNTQSHPPWRVYGDDDKYWRLIDSMKTIANDHRCSVPQVAVRWLLKKPVVTSVVIGVKTIEQLEVNMLAADQRWDLTDADMAELDAESGYDMPYPYELINRTNVRNVAKQ